jgi:hypothetical protein
MNGLIIGGSGVGKTVLSAKLIQNHVVMFDTPFSEILFYYTEWQEIYDTLASECAVKFIEGPPSLDHFPPNAGAKLVFIDDFMDQLGNKEFLKLAIKGTHHRNLSCFILSQCIFPKHMREISLNAHYCILFKTCRDLAQVRTFTMQIDPQNWKALMEAYQDATQEGHSYLLFDFHPKQKEHLRLRTHILPGESTVVYIPKSKYKSSMNQQSLSVAHDGP